jgi:MFS family permease
MPFDRAALPIVISGCLSLAFAMGVGRFAYTPILPLMLEEDLLSIGTGGTIASVHFIGYAIGAFLASRLAAAGPETLLVSLLAVGLSTLGMGVWENTQLWLAARFVAGLCSAFVLVSVSTMSIRHLAEIGRPELQGWVFAGVGAGIAVVGILVLGFLAAGTRSGAVWLVFGLLSLAGTGVVWKLDGRHSRPVSQPFDGQVGGGRKPVSWRLALPYGAMGLGYIIPATYLPVMAREAVSSPLVYGWGWPLFGAAAAVSTILVARLQRRYSNRAVWIVGQFVMAAGLIAPAVWPTMMAIVIAALCVGGTFMVITMIGMKEAHRVAGPDDAQRHIAVMTFAFAVGQIAGPFVAGFAYEATRDFAYPLLVASALLVLTLAPMAFQRNGS